LWAEARVGGAILNTNAFDALPVSVGADNLFKKLITAALRKTDRSLFGTIRALSAGSEVIAARALDGRRVSASAGTPSSLVRFSTAAARRDARRCISYLTIELKGWIPLELRPLLGNWIYGCDICQNVCPFNRFATPANAEFFKGSLDFMAPSLLDLLSLDEAGFTERYKNSPIKRLKRSRFLRNVSVATGNWGSVTAVPPLINLLNDPDPYLRGHAAWALHQIDDASAKTALQQALPTENNDEVRRELIGEI
jgi:hypothetical protein